MRISRPKHSSDLWICVFNIIALLLHPKCNTLYTNIDYYIKYMSDIVNSGVGRSVIRTEGAIFCTVPITQNTFTNP